MTDQVTNQDSTQSEQPNLDTTLYAGKFKTVEELEAGYKNAAKIYQENEVLKQKLETVSKPPEMYVAPADVDLGESDLEGLKKVAKNANLNQTQFETLLREQYVANQTQKQKKEQALKDLGEENLNVLKDYVERYYPAKVRDSVLDKIVLDKEAREAALHHRQSLLNTSIPGMSKHAVGNYHITYDDLLKSREAYIKQPSNMKLREEYLKRTAQYAEQNKK